MFVQDALLIHVRKSWGFFGVFDGHGGNHCSEFLAKEYGRNLHEYFAAPTAEELRGLALELDARFLGSASDQLSLLGHQHSGSTAAFVVVKQLPGGHTPGPFLGKKQGRTLKISQLRR